MSKTQHMQTCSRCGRDQALSDFRRHRRRHNGRDSVCKECRKAADRAARAGSFGPLPGPDGSDGWIEEIWRRAGTIRKQ